MTIRGRFDAPFWGLLLTGAFLVGSLSFFALAAAAQAATPTDAALVSTDY